MARPFRLLIAGAALSALGFILPPPPALGGAPEGPDGPRGKANRPPIAPLRGDNSPAMDNVRRSLEALTPEQRKRFGENLMRWANLSPEEKKALREREEVRQKYMEGEIAAAIAESGLKLEGERRVQFVRRFGEERRKIEEQLHHELMEKRKPLVRELIGRLKTEFSVAKP